MSLKLRTAMSAWLLVSAGTATLAQQPGTTRPSAAPASASGASAEAAPTAPAAPAPVASSSGAPSYRSAFDGYRAYAEQPVLPWREANNVVGRIGGWQSYAREGQGGPAAGSGETPAPAAEQGKPEMPGMPASHGGMSMQAPGSTAPAPTAGGASTSKAPMKMPAQGPKAAATPARPKSATAPGAASAAMPGGHTGQQKP